MYELNQVTQSCYYIESPAKIGLVKLGGDDVCLIDSGNDKEAGRKIRQILDANGWRLRAIYNTHSNADHIGGNKYLQTQTGCDIFAPGIERDFCEHPILEPSFLYGAFPPKSLRHKFLMAQESEVDLLRAEAMPENLSILPLPGHFFDMVGYRSADGAVYLADCLASEQTLEKYQITFVYDVEAYINTLELVKTLDASIFIPAHAATTEQIAPLAQKNIDKVHEIADRIEELCAEPIVFERVLQRLFRAFDLKMNIEQYVLVGSTVRSYLSWLNDAGKIEYFFEEEQMLWRKKA
jgi:glyoxylase-like metal-dependent hydrolase (beta-lactamase superfamily II)